MWYKMDLRRKRNEKDFDYLYDNADGFRMYKESGSGDPFCKE